MKSIADSVEFPLELNKSPDVALEWAELDIVNDVARKVRARRINGNEDRRQRCIDSVNVMKVPIAC